MPLGYVWRRRARFARSPPARTSAITPGTANFNWPSSGLEIIGEAARRLSEGFREAHPEIPWRRIIGQRNVLAHEYGEILHDRLWTVVTIDLPDLIGRLESLLPSPPPAG